MLVIILTTKVKNGDICFIILLYISKSKWSSKPLYIRIDTKVKAIIAKMIIIKYKICLFFFIYTSIKQFEISKTSNNQFL